MEASRKSSVRKKILLIFNIFILLVGSAGGPLTLRLYFDKGGKSVWLSTFLQTAAFPALLIPMAAAYFLRRRKALKNNDEPAKLILMDWWLFAASAAIGVLYGGLNFFYGYGVGALPVSTSNIITASQLAFTAVFSFFIVKQKFTFLTVNALVLLTAGPIIMGFNTKGDRPDGESKKKYIIGFAMTVAAAVLNGLALPLVEKVYEKAKQAVTFDLVMELQFVMNIFATLVSGAGLFISGQYKGIGGEAMKYELGVANYIQVLIWNAIVWQLYFLGSNAVVFSANALVSGIAIAVCVPITEVFGVYIFHEKFQFLKGFALCLALWGFVSYFYGDCKKMMMKKASVDQNLLPTHRSLQEDSTGIPP